MENKTRKIQITLHLPKDRKNLNNPKPSVNHRATICIPKKFNEADFIKAFYELQRFSPNILLTLKAKQTKKTIEIKMKQIEFVNFGKYKTYDNEYELIFDHADYETILYAMEKQCKKMGVL